MIFYFVFMKYLGTKLYIFKWQPKGMLLKYSYLAKLYTVRILQENVIVNSMLTLYRFILLGVNL